MITVSMCGAADKKGNSKLYELSARIPMADVDGKRFATYDPMFAEMRRALGEAATKYGLRNGVGWNLSRDGQPLGEPGCWLEKCQWMTEVEAEWLARAQGKRTLRWIPREQP
jgi:hypothetical protein